MKTTRPSNKDTDKVKLEGGSQNASAVIELSDSDASDQEPYVTPFLLEKKKRKIAPALEDTEVEHSEVEQQLRWKASKKDGPVKSSTDKVRWSLKLLITVQVVTFRLQPCSKNRFNQLPLSMPSKPIPRRWIDTDNCCF